MTNGWRNISLEPDNCITENVKWDFPIKSDPSENVTFDLIAVLDCHDWDLTDAGSRSPGCPHMA